MDLIELCEAVDYCVSFKMFSHDRKRNVQFDPTATRCTPSPEMQIIIDRNV